MEVSGVMHVHSRYSRDGEMTLKQIKDLCKSKGNEFVFMTEHIDGIKREEMGNFVSECQELSERDFLVIPGFEITTKEDVHILGFGIKDFPTQKLSAEETVSEVHRQNGLAVLAHPVRYDGRVALEVLKYVDGLEVWNTLYDNKHLFNFTGFFLAEKIRKEKPNFLFFCGLDMHKRRQFFNLKICLNIETLSGEEIIENLRRGDYSVKYSFFKITFKATKAEKIFIFFTKIYFNLIKLCWRSIEVKF